MCFHVVRVSCVYSCLIIWMCNRRYVLSFVLLNFVGFLFVVVSLFWFLLLLYMFDIGQHTIVCVGRSVCIVYFVCWPYHNKWLYQIDLHSKYLLKTFEGLKKKINHSSQFMTSYLWIYVRSRVYVCVWFKRFAIAHSRVKCDAYINVKPFGSSFRDRAENL